MLLLISLLSFFLPTQLALHANGLQTTVYGFRIDYLTPTLYLTDIIAVLIIILGVRKFKLTKKYIVYSVLYISFAAINILHSIYYLPALYKWIRLTEMALLAVTILKNKKFNLYKNFVVPLSYSMIVVNFLGIFQFLNKGSIGGIFYWLGERAFRFSDPNISPFPYSTFSHPNSYAGFLLVFFIFLLQYKSKFKPFYFWMSAILIGINLVMTNSQNVYLTIVLLLIIKLKPNFSHSFLSFDFLSRSFTHRIELIKTSLQLIKENFWIGVGLNNFIPNLPLVTNKFLNSWELQPVHNIFLLIFSEVGIFGLVAFLFLFLFALSPATYSLYAIAITGLSDHYWLTLQQNILLLTYTLAIGYAKK